ncbi:MAG: porin [Gammaproteobacteria bacterium]|nr:porin [Gammaproteobacteria bacterium]MDE2250742.1 porin [Gammaproteobacteria bacterium]
MRKFACALTFCVFFAALPYAAIAADAGDTKAPAVSLADMLSASGVAVDGYVDAAYSYLSGDGVFTSGTSNRVFDTEPNSFNLHQAALLVAYQPKEGFGAYVNLTAGRDARVIKSYDTTTNDFDVTQAYVQYAHGPLTVIGGKYVTLAGAEVINSTADVNYSRSILFGYAIPFAHTGVRATYVVNSTLTLIGGVTNGWDQLKDQNRQKTLELGVGFVPSKFLSLAVQGYTGVEQVYGVIGGISGQRNLVDVVATITANDRLSFILNYDYASQDNFTSLANGSTIKAKWSGTAGYLNYMLSNQWRLGLRGEYFDDTDGYRTGVIQKWKEATLTLGYLPSKSVEIRTEVRGDRSDANSFVSGVSAKKDQSSVGLEAIFKF